MLTLQVCMICREAHVEASVHPWTQAQSQKIMLAQEELELTRGMGFAVAAGFPVSSWRETLQLIPEGALTELRTTIIIGSIQKDSHVLARVLGSRPCVSTKRARLCPCFVELELKCNFIIVLF